MEDADRLSDRVRPQKRFTPVEKDLAFPIKPREEKIDGFSDRRRIEREIVLFLITIATMEIAFSRHDEGEYGIHVAV